MYVYVSLSYLKGEWMGEENDQPSSLLHYTSTNTGHNMQNCIHLCINKSIYLLDIKHADIHMPRNFVVYEVIDCSASTSITFKRNFPMS